MHDELMMDYVLERMQFIPPIEEQSVYWGKCRKPQYNTETIAIFENEDIVDTIICISYMLIADNGMYMPRILRFEYTNPYGTKVYFSIEKEKYTDLVRLQVDKIVTILNW